MIETPTDSDILVEINEQKEHPTLQTALVYDLIVSVLLRMEVSQGELSILLCDNDTIHRMNNQYRGKDHPTDVLSFVTHDVTHYLGDIAISLDKIETQAREYGVTFEDEFKRILIHGILHCLGYHHEDDKEAEKEMMSLQNSILEEVKQNPICYPS